MVTLVRGMSSTIAVEVHASEASSEPTTHHFTYLTAKYILLKPLDQAIAFSIQDPEWDETKAKVRSDFANIISRVAEYLVGPSVVMLAVALQSESGQSTAASKEVVDVFRGCNPRRKLDFSKICKQLGRKMTDEIIYSMLCAVDASKTLRSVKFGRAYDHIAGHGLEPLRGSNVLREINVGTIPEQRAGEIIDSILECPKSNLHTAIVPTSWARFGILQLYLKKRRQTKKLVEEYGYSWSLCSNPSCNNCEDDDTVFSICPDCTIFKYCCRQCQVDHRREHKVVCNLSHRGAAAIREAVD